MQATRTDFLRNHALNQNIETLKSEEFDLLYMQGWIDNNTASSNIVRRAKAKAYSLKNATPIIDDYELIVGKSNFRKLGDKELIEKDNLIKAMQAASITSGQNSHMSIDYEKLLNLGVEGIKNEIIKYQSTLNLSIRDNVEKNEFYKSCLIVLDGLLSYADNYAAHAQFLAEKCDDKERKNELYEIAQILKKVPRYGATTFREAIQSIHFVTFCLCIEGLYQLGRPDRYLIDYYRNDIKNNTINKEQAQELIDCLCIMFNEYIPKGLAIGFMVGGTDKDGNEIINELTYMFIESIGNTRMIYPGIGLCYTKNTPQDLLEKSCVLLSEGLSHPALFNDETIIKGLRKYGLTTSEACNYIHSTCVEITPGGCSAVWVASPYINLVQILLDIINEPNAKYDSYKDLESEYRKRLGVKIKNEAINQNLYQMERWHHGGNPLVSCFVNDCLAKGRDVDMGGARYNWIMPSFVGLSNLTDSLMVVKSLVFEKKELTLGELSKILDDNFSDIIMHQKILNRVPKYGNDVDDVDFLAQKITNWLVEETSKHTTYRGDRFIPSLFCWVMHEILGKETGASPDGRVSGFPLGDGSGPAQGREKKGPTASIISSTKWDHSPFIGGIAINMKFNKSFFKKETLGKMISLIKAFMLRGGFELQINVIDNEVLKKAKENPELYRDIIVRIGGYSDYFVHLSPEMQDEVITRTGHNL